jgi:hypothetical protein
MWIPILPYGYVKDSFLCENIICSDLSCVNIPQKITLIHCFMLIKPDIQEVARMLEGSFRHVGFRGWETHFMNIHNLIYVNKDLKQLIIMNMPKKKKRKKN